jgi:hypothetical protein
MYFPQPKLDPYKGCRGRVELSFHPGYDRGVMTVSQSGHPAFLEGFRRGPLVISVIGGIAFVAGFLVQDVHGLGRALGLSGIGIVLCAFTTNLLLEAFSGNTDAGHKRRLVEQAAFTLILAIAVFLLAAYLYRYGTLPGFMPPRYDQQHHA